MVNYSWSQYWADKTDGGHRYKNEAFYKMEAQEKLFHLCGGESLLDFGCGSADLLIYIIPQYKKVTGIDFSLSMLAKARDKITHFNFKNVNLIHADDQKMWAEIDQSYDRIINIQVIQHMTHDQIDNFIKNATKKLNPNGKIIFFDVIEPRRFYLWKSGFFSNDSHIIYVMFQFIKLRLLHLIRSAAPDDKIMGFAYNPQIIEKIAEKYNLQMEYVASMYYEYRYHAILFPKNFKNG